MSWYTRYMDLARHVSTWSKDKSTKVGCVIVAPDERSVVAMGYNGFPRGANDEIPERHARPLKYEWTEHAERNAIYNAANRGIALHDCVMYLHWFPCTDCARAIVQTGIRQLNCPTPDFKDERWGEKFEIALQILREGRVTVRFVDEAT